MRSGIKSRQHAVVQLTAIYVDSGGVKRQKLGIGSCHNSKRLVHLEVIHGGLRQTRMLEGLHIIDQLRES